MAPLCSERHIRIRGPFSEHSDPPVGPPALSVFSLWADNHLGNRPLDFQCRCALKIVHLSADAKLDSTKKYKPGGKLSEGSVGSVRLSL